MDSNIEQHVFFNHPTVGDLVGSLTEKASNRSASLIIQAAKDGDLSFFQESQSSSTAILNARCNAGCSVLHWAAGSGHLALLHYLLDTIFIIRSANGTIKANVDLAVTAKSLAQGRTPLHYASRNGHLQIVQVLIESYSANPQSLTKEGVTPFQLAVWQNHLHICKYLVHTCHVIPSEDVNEFGCGVLHWMGIVPIHRVSDADTLTLPQRDTSNEGDTLKEPQEVPSILPMAKWLTSQPNMKIFARQNQGQTILHKASWGGHLNLVVYLHETFDMYDDCTDDDGNYAADLADMAHSERHAQIALYLRRECSLERLQSLQVLGLTEEGGHGTSGGRSLKKSWTHEEVRRAYLEKAKGIHSDEQQRATNYGLSWDNKGDYQEQINSSVSNTCSEFDELRKAYEHLTIGGAVATKQRKPAQSCIHSLLEKQAIAINTTRSTNDPGAANKKSLLLLLFEEVMVQLAIEAQDLVEQGFRKALPDVNDVSATTNFVESGGTSMQILVLRDFINSNNGQRASLQQNIEQHVFFTHPTVEDLVGLLTEKAMVGGNAESAKLTVEAHLINSGSFYPASFQQEQMYILDASGYGAAYNMPWVLDIKGTFNRELIIKALDCVVKREQPLRSVFKLSKKTGIVQQKIFAKTDSLQLFAVVDHSANTFEEAIEILTKEQGFSFNLKEKPISRMNIVKISDKRSVVMVNGHHVNHDGWSVVNFRRHLLRNYTDLVTGKDINDDADHEYDYLAWSLWQQTFVARGSAEYKKQLDYWKSELKGASTVEFPRDKPITASRTNAGKMVTLSVSPDIMNKWKEDLSANGCTVFMGGLTVLHILISRWCGINDIVTGAAVANRNAHSAYSERLGSYANILTIRSKSNPNITYNGMLHEVRSKILGSWTAQDIPYHQVIADLGDSNFRGFNIMYAM